MLHKHFSCNIFIVIGKPSDHQIVTAVVIYCIVAVLIILIAMCVVFGSTVFLLKKQKMQDSLRFR